MPWCRVAAIGLLLLAPHSTASGTEAPSRSLAECEERVRQFPESTDVYRCFLQLTRRRDSPDEVLARLEGILALHPDNGLVRLALAGVEADRGADRAEVLFREAIGDLARAGHGEAEIEGRLALSMFLAVRGRLDDAEGELDASATVADRLGAPLPRARVDTHRGLQAYRRGEYDRALRLLRSVEDTILRDGSVYHRSDWLSALGATYWAMARYLESLEAYRRQAVLLRRVGDPYEEAVARSNIALLTASLTPMPWGAEERSRITELVREALKIAESGGNRFIIAKSHLYLAQLTTVVTERRRHLVEVLAESDRTSSFEDMLLAMRLLADSLSTDEPKDPSEALRLTDEAERLARGRGMLEGVLRARVVRAGIEWDLGRGSGWVEGKRERAIEASFAAMDAIEALRDRQSQSEIRARTFAPWAWVYYQTIGSVLWPPDAPPAPEDLDLAFRVAERMRTRVFLDELDAARAAAGATLPRQQRIREEIAVCNRRLMNPTLADEERRTILAELERLELEEAALRGEIGRPGTVVGSLRSPHSPSLDRVREALAENEALLSFVVSDLANRNFLGGSWLVAVTHENAKVYRIPERKELDDAVRLLAGLVGNRDGSEVAGAVRLYRDLLYEALADLAEKVDRLIILPDGPLHRLPFGLLRSEVGSEPLALRYGITLAPSAAAWLLWRRAGTDPAEQPALALIDPELPMVPGARTGEGGTRSSGLPGVGSLGPLPHARREGLAVAHHLGSGSRVLAGAAATESYVKSAPLDRFAVLHFAAHALVDEKHPERSGVLLAPGSDEQDGLLQVREAVSLSLPKRVVVLSGCRSASGAVFAGEGPMSLARAFFVAGAHAVIGSLWPLRDDEAAALFEDFYRHLGEGAAVAEALAAARRDRLTAGAPSAAWAGVVLYGNGDLVPLPGGRRDGPWAWWQLAAAAGLLALVAGARGLLLFRRHHVGGK